MSAEEIRAWLDGADGDTLIELPARTLRAALAERDELVAAVDSICVILGVLDDTVERTPMENAGRVAALLGRAMRLHAERARLPITSLANLAVHDLAADAAIAECRGDDCQGCAGCRYVPGSGDSDVEQCDARAHRDFTDEDIRCELPAGHAAHRNGQRERTP